MKIILLALLAGVLAITCPTCQGQEKGDISFAVKKEGKGRAILFIPGLYCSGEVWSETVAHFKNRYECHTITLPGFAGQPPLAPDSILQTVVNQLALYVRRNKLVKPVLVGHSLGGCVALAFGIRYPELAGDIVCVSSAPFLPALSMGAGITMDSSRNIGMRIKQAMITQTPAQVRQYQQYMLGTMIRDSAKIAMVTEMAVRSDPATQGEVMYELFSTDLRPALAAVQSRILVTADWSAYKQYGATHESVYTNLKAQYSNAGRVTIVVNDASKHFIMFDEPAWLWREMEAFLK